MRQHVSVESEQSCTKQWHITSELAYAASITHILTSPRCIKNVLDEVCSVNWTEDAISHLKRDMTMSHLLLCTLLFLHSADATEKTAKRKALLKTIATHTGTAKSVEAAKKLSRLPSPLDELSRDNNIAVALKKKLPDEVVAVLDGGFRASKKITFSPDSTLLAASSLDQRGRIWKMTGEKPKKWAEFDGGSSQVVFSPDGKMLVTGSRGTSAKLWDVTQKDPKLIRNLHGHYNRPFAVAFAPNGKLLATGCFLPVLRVWKIDGKEADAWGILANERVSSLGISSLAFSADSNLLAAGHHAGKKTLRLWSVGGQFMLERTLPAAQARLVAFSPDNKMLAFCDKGAEVRLWDVSGDKPKPRTALTFGSKQSDPKITALAFALDGQTLAAASNDGRILLWDIPSGKLHRVIRLPLQANDIDYAADGRHLATANEDGSVFVLRLSRFEEED